jgi:hypothetical protein
VVGLRVLYKARLIQLFLQLLTIPAIIVCLRYVALVHGFPLAALPDLLSRHGFISAEGRLSETFGCCSVEAF